MIIFRLVDLFCGAGGMSRGFVDADQRFTPIFAVDNDPWAALAYELNFPTAHVEARDISALNSFPKAEVLIGGPPCQGFSMMGRRDPDDPLNSLWEHFCRAVEEVEPLVFVMENVPRLLQSEHYIRFSRRIGKQYDVHEAVLRAADYGVPQARTRAFIIGSRIGSADAWIPLRTHFPPLAVPPDRQQWQTVRDAFAGIPSEPCFGADIHWDKWEPRSGADLHFARRITPLSMRRYKAVPAGGNRFDLPEELKPPCWLRNTTGARDHMGRLKWEKPSVTIRTEFWKPEKGRYLHPTADRPLTHWEAARLQTFSDRFRFLGSKLSVGKQIGNAVPPMLARSIAERIAAGLDEQHHSQLTAVA